MLALTSSIHPQSLRLACRTVMIISASFSRTCMLTTTDFRFISRLTQINTQDCIYHAQAGMKLLALHPVLRQNGLAISSLGSISDQTLAGCLSTATHGSGVTFGNLSSRVEFLDMVLPLPDAPLVRVSRQSDPDLFLSALCGLGTVGVIVAVAAKCEPAFNLEEECWTISFADFVERWQEIAESAQHVRCWWFPQIDQVKVSRLTRTMKVRSRASSSMARAQSGSSGSASHSGTHTATISCPAMVHRDSDRQILPRHRAHSVTLVSSDPAVPRARHVLARAPPGAVLVRRLVQTNMAAIENVLDAPVQLAVRAAQVETGPAAFVAVADAARVRDGVRG